MILPITLTLVLTFLSPFINAWIQNVNWSPKVKNLIAIGVSAVIALLFLVTTGTIADWTQLGVVIPAVYGLQQAVYQFFLKNIATKFEAITTKGSVIVTASETPGKVDITSDATIKETGDNITVDPPAQITPTPLEITKEADVKG